MKHKLTILIPLNYRENKIKELVDGLRKLPMNCEIIIVQNENNLKIKSRNMKVFTLKNKSYGELLKKGIRESRGDYIITIEPDCRNLKVIKDLWNHRNKAELVIASRYVKGSKNEMPFFRNVFSIMLNKFFTKILAVPVTDISSSYRLYHRKILQKIKIAESDYSVLKELLVRIYNDGWHIIEIPFNYKASKNGKTYSKLLRLFNSYLSRMLEIWRLRNSFFAADYDERAYYSKIPLQRYWQRKRYKLIMDMLGKKRNKIVDIGCGSSKIIQNLPNAFAVDIDVKKLRYLRRTNKKIVKASVFDLPFKDKSFKTVICSQVIEHVKKDKRIFREFDRVLKPGGLLILGTVDYGKTIWNIIERIYSFIKPNAYADDHISHYTRRDLINWLKKSNYKILDEKYICNSEIIIKAQKTK